MAGISGLGGGINYSVLFGGNDSSTKAVASDSLLGLDMSAVTSIKNGSYGKLLKNYYKQSKADAKAQVGDTDAKLTDLKKSADKLELKAETLNNSKLWETKAASKDGKATEELANSDKAFSAVKDFVSSYNKMIDEAGGSETKAVLRKTGWMANMTRENSNLLSQVGIKVGADDKLTLNEDAFKKADVTTLKEMFYGNDSYASKVSAKAAGIGRSAANTEGIYTGKGAWSSDMTQMTESLIGKAGGAEKEESADTPFATKTTEGKKTLTEEDSNKIKDLQDQKAALQKSYESGNLSYDQFKNIDQQIGDINKQIEKLYGTV
ncbi:MAG: hypothetical protein K6B69_16975 [Lachnospiraceae bacterium]|nr:hypothetical protein [Lachnospiraceae bacterium]